MSILAHIKHFLNEDGKAYFPEWFRRSAPITKQQPGFISVKYAFDSEDLECIHLWVEFESLTLMQQWAASEKHKVIVEKLNPYRTRAFEVERFEVLGKI